MNLDEQAINFVKDYFEAIAHNALEDAYHTANEDTTFAEFMETLFQKLGRLSAEHVAAEVLQLSSSKIENYNNGAGMEVDDIQDLIDNYEDEEMDLDDDE
jgi:ketosteroid isomerase-like protein